MVYNSIAPKYQTSYRKTKDKQKIVHATMELVRQASMKVVRGEWSRARISAKTILTKVWSKMLPLFLVGAEDPQ